MVASALLLCLVTFVPGHWGASWCGFALGTFCAGHWVLVLLLARGRLNYPPRAGSWLDFLTVLWAPWLGPIAWYLAWKKTKGGANVRGACEEASQ
jgi:hypothetical protein